MDVQQFKVTPLANGTTTIAGNAVQWPRFQIEGKVYDENVLVQDFTGADRVLTFPECLLKLTPDDRNEIIQDLALNIVTKLAV